MPAMAINSSDKNKSNGSTEVGARPIIGRSTPASEILEHLGRHGCEDVTDRLDTSTIVLRTRNGGFGDVYSGTLQNGDQVAIKCLRIPGMNDSDTKQSKHAAHELYAWSKCRHPNILELVGVAMYNDQIAMVSPWMKNQNLSQYLTRHPQADRFKLCSQIADAVAYLRDEDMVHGDIKCANILVSEDHTPQLADFGSAVIGKYTLAFTATTTGPHATLRWAAPEISNGESRHTFESDVYALGMTILEIFTGSIPYNGLSDIAVIKCISQKIPPERPQQHIPIGKISSTLLWALMKSCWDKDPQSRPPALQIRDELKAIMEAQRFDDRLVAEEISADRLQVTDDYDLVTSTTTARNREHLSVQFDNIHNAISRLDEAGTIPTLSTIVATWLGIGSTASAEWGKIRQLAEASILSGTEMTAKAKELLMSVIPPLQDAAIPPTERRIILGRLISILEASDRGAKTMSKELANISKKISDFRNIYASRVQASIGNKRRYLGAQIETFLERVDGYRVQAELSQVKDDLYKTLVDLEKLEADTSSLKEIYIACGIIIEELVVIESTTRVLVATNAQTLHRELNRVNNATEEQSMLEGTSIVQLFEGAENILRGCHNVYSLTG